MATKPSRTIERVLQGGFEIQIHDTEELLKVELHGRSLGRRIRKPGVNKPMATLPYARTSVLRSLSRPSDTGTPQNPRTQRKPMVAEAQGCHPSRPGRCQRPNGGNSKLGSNGGSMMDKARGWLSWLCVWRWEQIRCAGLTLSSIPSK